MYKEDIAGNIVNILISEYNISKELSLQIVSENPSIINKALESGVQSMYAAAMLLNWKYGNERSEISNFR